MEGLLILGQMVVIIGSLGGLIIYLIKNTEKRLNDRIDSLAQQVSETNKRLGSLEEKFSGLEIKFSGLEAKFSGMDGKVDSLHSIIAPKLELKEA